MVVPFYSSLLSIVSPSTISMISIQRLRFLSSPSFLSRFTPNSLPFTSSFSSSPNAQIEHTTSTTATPSLTQEEITQINLLIPRLCSSNHLKEAANLISTAFLTNPSLESLSISIFIHRLSLEHDLTQSMYFLNSLKYTPKTQSFLLPICKMLVSLYFREREAKKALKIFHWVSRPDFPCVVDYGFCAVLVNGFCKNDMVVEGLKVLRVMVFGNLKVGGEVRMLVYRSLLREARIKEAQELNEALKCVVNGDKGNEEVVALLDSIISNWIE
ncbi:uncharacterized protein LOC132038586 [Lycium ferocissimum]|uniref:uncharacterized protein LOC132038586 n=1 Tax=Lycium ferocissimum TaxID=112874 RepID=UPI00281683D6|nr:uncharacterized protein LOC132038586 [Lycium ferocissimum]XP_059285230.1 uncharacterized protein LOC132038586 [Lycium ferocissimum]